MQESQSGCNSQDTTNLNSNNLNTISYPQNHPAGQFIANERELKVKILMDFISQSILCAHWIIIWYLFRQQDILVTISLGQSHAFQISGKLTMLTTEIVIFSLVVLLSGRSNKMIYLHLFPVITPIFFLISALYFHCATRTLLKSTKNLFLNILINPGCYVGIAALTIAFLNYQQKVISLNFFLAGILAGALGNAFKSLRSEEYEIWLDILIQITVSLGISGIFYFFSGSLNYMEMLILLSLHLFYSLLVTIISYKWIFNSELKENNNQNQDTTKHVSSHRTLFLGFLGVFLLALVCLAVSSCLLSISKNDLQKPPLPHNPPNPKPQNPKKPHKNSTFPFSFPIPFPMPVSLPNTTKIPSKPLIPEKPKNHTHKDIFPYASIQNVTGIPNIPVNIIGKLGKGQKHKQNSNNDYLIQQTQEYDILESNSTRNIMILTKLNTTSVEVVKKSLRHTKKEDKIENEDK